MFKFYYFNSIGEIDSFIVSPLVGTGPANAGNLFFERNVL